MTSLLTQMRDHFTRHRFLAAILLLSSACLLLAADNAGSGPAPDKTTAHPYNYPFGASPFLPSQAKTESAAFIDSTAFPTATFCSRCHEDVHQQWRQSAHANSFRAPFYKKNVDLLIAQKGIEFS
ncbi:MAG: tetratricopeptide repeat protein, partial [Candidatus Angelobacter sp.]